MRTQMKALVEHGVRHWLSSRGLWLVVAATLLPLLLTGAWTATHDADISARELSWSPTNPVEGDNLTVRGTIENTGGSSVDHVNVTLAVGRVTGNRLIPTASTTESFGPLEGGETARAELNWTTRPGAYYALLDADPENQISEVEEFNNRIPKPLVVPYGEPNASQGPDPPGNLTGNASANQSADLAVVDLTVTPEEPTAGENVTIQATFEHRGGDPVTNATLSLQLVQSFSGRTVPVRTVRPAVNLTPGQTHTLNFTWESQGGVRWVQAYASVPDTHHDPDAEDQAQTTSLVTQPTRPDEPPEPPERVTLKQFYLDVLNLLHLRILLPLVALFFAGGVIADDRSAGNLSYLLTRPLPRWALPVTRFASGFVVASVATAIGIVGTFFVIFGTPVSDVGFLTTPLLISLVTLLVYGSLFTALGVLVDRPYLVGVLFVIGWETAAGFLVPWVNNLTLHHWIGEAVRSWPLDQGLVWLPEETTALYVLLGVAVASVILAGVLAERREYPDA